MANPIARWQIISPNADLTSTFYCDLFGWQATRDNMLNYQQIDTGCEHGVNGGIWPAPPGAPSFVQLFMQVDDCAAYVVRATELGASVLIPVTALPDGDVMAILKDPNGMSFGVMQGGE